MFLIHHFHFLEFNGQTPLLVSSSFFIETTTIFFVSNYDQHKETRVFTADMHL